MGHCGGSQHYARSSQHTNKIATHRNTLDMNCSSSNGVSPLWPKGLSPTWNDEVKNPNGKAPIPNDMWKPPSPNPNPGKPPLFSGSDLWPGGLGGVLFLGSSCLVLPLPYKGITLSLDIAALQTGQTCLLGLVSNHWCRQGQQNKWPHILTTASFAVSRQILHSNIRSSFSFSPLESFLSLDEDPDAEADASVSITILNI